MSLILSPTELVLTLESCILKGTTLPLHQAQCSKHCSCINRDSASAGNYLLLCLLRLHALLCLPLPFSASLSFFFFLKLLFQCYKLCTPNTPFDPDALYSLYNFTFPTFAQHGKTISLRNPVFIIVAPKPQLPPRNPMNIGFLRLVIMNCLHC